MPNPRALALAITALLTSACTVNGLSLATPDLGLKAGASAKPSGAPSGAPGQLPAQGATGMQNPQQPGGMQGQAGQPGQTGPGGQQQPGMQQPGGTMPGQTPVAGASSTPAVITDPTISAEVPEIYRRLYGASSLTVENGFLVVTTQSLPDHDSVYYDGTVWESTTHEGTDTMTAGKSPGSIGLVEYTLKIPLTPTVATTKTASAQGAMGMALNGIPFYNNLSGEGVPISHEIVSFDTFNGHPDPGGVYHYHVEPKFLTAKFGRDALLGWLIDGYPVYGPVENGKELTNADLDADHGHEHATADYPQGIYHYHITAADPYINGGYYHGVPGQSIRGGGQMPQGGGQQQPGGQQPGGQQQPGGTQTGSPPPGGQQGGTQQQPGGQQQQPGGQTGQPPAPPSGCPTPPPPGQRPSPIPGGIPSWCPTPPGGMPPPPQQ